MSKILRRFKTFDLCAEAHDAGDRTIDMQIYRSKTGEYITAKHGGRRPGLVKLIAELEISPEKSNSKHSVCSIGRSAKDGKWYGWSHRAIVGFGKGDMIFDENAGDSSTLFTERGTRRIKTDDDAREAAVNFSRYVS